MSRILVSIHPHKRLRTCLKWFAVVSLALLVSINIMAFMHAGAMTHFQDVPAKTRQAETLSAWEKARVLLTGVKLPRPANKGNPMDAGMPFDTLRVSGSKDVDLPEEWNRVVADFLSRLNLLTQTH